MRKFTPDDLEAELATERTPQGYTWWDVLDVCCAVVGISRKRAVELVPTVDGVRFVRSSKAVEARRLSFAVVRVLGGYSYPTIGAVWGGIDHATVMEARPELTGPRVPVVVARLAVLFPAPAPLPSVEARGPGLASASCVEPACVEVA